MKKTILIGPAAVDLAAYVEKLPRSNEDEIKPIRTLQREGGAGWCSASVFANLNFDYVLFCAIGSGMYGDAVRSAAKRNNITLSFSSDEIAGCTYTMIDPQGRQGVMIVPGAEYSFKSEWSDSISPQDVKSVLLAGSMLDGADTNDLLDFLNQYDGRIFFMMQGRGVMQGSSVLNSIYALHPLVFVSDEEIGALFPQAKDLMDAGEQLQKKTDAPMLILMQDGTGVYLDKRSGISSSSTIDHVVNASGVQESYGAAFLAARNAGLRPHEALMFAGAYASAVADSEEAVLPEAKTEWMRQKLLDLILSGGKKAN